MTIPVIVYTQEPSGQCPVQAEGTINGREFYFRSRGEHWRLYVAPENGIDPFHKEAWRHSEIYPGCIGEEPYMSHGTPIKFGAGHAQPDECKEFITRAAARWVEAQAKSNPSSP